MKQHGTNFEALHKNVKIKCIEQGVAMNRVQALSGMKSGTFYLRMRNPGSIRLDELCGISKALHVSVAELIDGVES
jgi:hypothetical protein